MLHSIKPQKEQHQDKDDIDKVNINSININFITFDSKCSVITAKLNTSSCQAPSVVPHKVNSGSDGNIMPFHIFKKICPRFTKEQLRAMKNENIKLRTCNSKTITQLDRCTVRIENNNKMKMCSFFVVPGNGQHLLGMPNIKTIGILTVNCNTIEMKEADSSGNYKTNTSQEIDTTGEYYTTIYRGVYTQTTFQNLKMKIGQ